MEMKTKSRQYVAVLDGAGEVWGVRFPDLPGCYGGGASPEAAIEDGVSALREYAEHQIRSGYTLPQPRLTAEIISGDELDVSAGETAFLVPLFLDDARTVKANVTLDAGLLKAIDAEAKLRGLTRSAFLASAAREKIAERR
jgi:predicted RNase H-like HicB family nuclease